MSFKLIQIFLINHQVIINIVPKAMDLDPNSKFYDECCNMVLNGEDQAYVNTALGEIWGYFRLMDQGEAVKAIKMLRILPYYLRIPEKYLHELLTIIDNSSQKLSQLNKSIIDFLAGYFVFRCESPLIFNRFTSILRYQAQQRIPTETIQSLQIRSDQSERNYILGVLLSRDSTEAYLSHNIQGVVRSILIKELIQGEQQEDIALFNKSLEKFETSNLFEVFDIDRDQCLIRLFQEKKHLGMGFCWVIQELNHEPQDVTIESLGMSMGLSGSMGGIRSSLGMSTSRARAMRTTTFNLRQSTMAQIQEVSEPLHQNLNERESEGEQKADEQKNNPTSQFSDEQPLKKSSTSMKKQPSALSLRETAIEVELELID